MNLKVRLKELGGAAMIAVLLGCSMSLNLLDALAISFSVWQAVLTGCATAVVCAAVLMNRFTALGAALCVGGGMAVLAVKNVGVVQMLRDTLISLLALISGGEGSLNEHAVVLMIVITLVLTLSAFMLTRLNGGVYPALLMFMFVIMGGWLIEKRLTPAYIVPGLVALAVLYARANREGMSFAKAVPAALIAALLAVTLMPEGQVTWKPLEDAAKKVQELFNDYFMFTDPRTVYSVSSDGYQPKGEELGGPATPRDADVMRVKTDRLLFMRGSVRRTYTGYSWVDNAINNRYLYLDPTRQSLREKVFDLDLNDALTGALSETDVSVTMLNEGTSTLFVPHRLKSLSVPLDLVAYYNDSGEVFITRGVEYGDSYSFAAYSLDAEDEQMAALTAAVLPGSDPDYQSAMDAYMNLPATLDADVYWLTQRVIENARTPYEKAVAIRNHLTSGEYQYRMDMEMPPSGRDFVSYFLLDAKEGYCTYYASAMAVMARLAGLPSRYIEGYLVQPDPSGETLVTGDNAHAWVEIYFEGVGWITFDATPGDEPGEGNSNNNNRHNPPESTPSPTPTAAPTPTPDPGSVPPEETPTPQPDATPEPSDQPQGEPDVTPTPDPGSAATPEPSGQPGSSENDQKRNNSWWKIFIAILLILLILLLLAWLIMRRWRSTDPAYVADSQDNNDTGLLVWYRAILTLLSRGGFVPEGGETPEQFADRAVKAGAAPEAFAVLTRAVTAQQYANGKTGEKALEQAQEVYEEMLEKLPKKALISWQMYRIMHGTGDYRQIP